jgi:inner membrane transporter RhtA
MIPMVLCLGAMNFDFYLAYLERIPIGLAVTLEFIGPLLVLFWLKRFVDFVMLAAAGMFDRSVDK